ncbi:MAG: carbohydrate-binding domain-containing protein [Oscillospiraceae bacterium]|nr:carbohydrate-binding domain-containing protein [Oscillospiraceae bacterium]
MKKIISILLTLSVIVSAFTACSRENPAPSADGASVNITLSDDGVLVDGQPAPSDSSAAVYTANDIIFYLAGQGADYGEGEEREEHTQEEADKHTVIHITQPGNYTITGSLSYGQIAVNLGEDAKDNPDAVVNLTLNGTDLTCTVAPAIICYSAYECGSDDTETATMNVDTAAAGFNLIVADGTVNNISGSHVARIYKPGTTDKLHKYDAAIESLVSLNIDGTDGVLNLTSDNEGIETKLHMTINGGIIDINSTDDSLNAGEDYVSVITINDGQILANANNGLEGDGIDSNGWLVINGGMVSAFSSDRSMDSGLDSDNGIIINGGIVYATGCMYDQISSESAQSVAVFSLDEWVYSEEYVVLKSSADETVAAFKSTADHKVIVYSSPLLTEDDYTLYKAQSVAGDSLNGIYTQVEEMTGETQLAHSSRGGFGGQRPEGGAMPEKEGAEPFEKPEGEMPQGGMEKPEGEMPMKGERPEIPEGFENMTPPEGFTGEAPEKPEDFNGEMPQMPENSDGQPSHGGRPQGEGGFDVAGDSRATTAFTFTKGINLFSGVKAYTA